MLRALEAELGQLPQEARDLATAAAAVGDPFDLDLTIAATGLPEEVVLSSLDELHLRDVVTPAALPRQFQFRHPLVRNAVYQSSRPGSRIRYHRRIVERLTERGAQQRPNWPGTSSSRRGTATRAPSRCSNGPATTSLRTPPRAGAMAVDGAVAAPCVGTARTSHLRAR